MFKIKSYPTFFPLNIFFRRACLPPYDIISDKPVTSRDKKKKNGQRGTDKKGVRPEKKNKWGQTGTWSLDIVISDSISSEQSGEPRAFN